MKNAVKLCCTCNKYHSSKCPDVLCLATNTCSKWEIYNGDIYSILIGEKRGLTQDLDIINTALESLNQEKDNEQVFRQIK